MLHVTTWVNLTDKILKVNNIDTKKAHTVKFCICEVSKQAKLIYGDRSQNTGYQWLFSGRGTF